MQRFSDGLHPKTDARTEGKTGLDLTRTQEECLLDKLISAGMNGDQMFRPGRIILDFFPKGKNKIVYRPGGGIIFITPDLIQKHVAGYDLALTLNEKLKDLKFSGGKF